MKILCIDIGGTSAKYALVQDGRILEKIKYKKTYLVNVDQLMQIIKEISLEFSAIDGISIASPGAIEKNRYVNFYTAIKGLELGFDIVEALQHKGIRKPVFVLNDANAAAYGEYRTHYSSCSSFSYLGIGSGIGGGAIVNGAIVEGFKGFGGEFGSAFEVWDKRTQKNISPQDIGGFHGMIRLWKKITKENITGKKLFEKFDVQESIAVEVIEEFYKAIVKTLWLITFTINPEQIVLGGGLAQRIQALEEIKQRFKIFAEKKGQNSSMILNIAVTKLFDKAPLLGCYHSFVQNQLKEKNNE